MRIESFGGEKAIINQSTSNTYLFADNNREMCVCVRWDDGDDDDDGHMLG